MTFQPLFCTPLRELLMYISRCVCVCFYYTSLHVGVINQKTTCVGNLHEIGWRFADIRSESRYFHRWSEKPTSGVFYFHVGNGGLVREIGTGVVVPVVIAMSRHQIAKMKCIRPVAGIIEKSSTPFYDIRNQMLISISENLNSHQSWFVSTDVFSDCVATIPHYMKEKW